MIPLHKPYFNKDEMRILHSVIKSGKTAGDCEYGKKSRLLMENIFNIKYALPVTSCTSALELAAMVLDIKAKDEILLPSFTMSSTVTAILRQGGIPKFVDIRKDTYNIDENQIEQNISKKTKAIFLVHYAGFPCNLDKIVSIAKKHSLKIVEDAAHAIGSKYKGKHLGTFGDIGCFSFHETKNIVCGEGGAFLSDNTELSKRAEIIREKGTNRSAFFRGEVDKYTWVDHGSSFVISDILASILYVQLSKLDEINLKRSKIANLYINGLKDLSDKITLPVITKDTSPNWHIFAIRVPKPKRDKMINKLKESGLQVAFHYVPLHDSPMGKKFGYKTGDLPITEEVANTLIRLPMYPSMTQKQINFIIDSIKKLVKSW